MLKGKTAEACQKKQSHHLTLKRLPVEFPMLTRLKGTYS